MTSMGGASRFLMLLSTPFPLLYPRPATLRLTRHSRALISSLYSTTTTTTTTTTSSSSAHSFPARPRGPPFSCPFPLSSSPRFSTRVAAAGDDYHAQSGVVEIGPSSHPWPEFSKLVEHAVTSGYSGCHEDDVFAEEYAVPGEFKKAADACLSFARARPDLLRLLSKKDIEVVVRNGSPFLFKNGSNSVRRLGSSLADDGANVSRSEVTETADLMRYLLSYAYNHLSSMAVNNSTSSKFVESSVRNLLSEVVDRSKIDSYHPESDNSREPFNLEVPATNPRQNIEMKRGDWICPKCSFLNFAKNTKCLECYEARPKRQLTGGEWECPQCDFFNYGRNMACLRCDCRRPEQVPARTVMPEVTLDSKGKPNVGHFFTSTTSDQSEIEHKLAENDEKAERWFKKVSQLGDSSDLSSAIDDEDFPEIMPLRKEENRFVASTRKTPLERLANDRYKRDFVSDGSSESYKTLYGHDVENGSQGTTDTSVSKTLDMIFGQSSGTPSTDRDSNSIGGTQYPQGSSAVLSEKFEQLLGSKIDKESSNLSERWSKQVADLDGVKDLASAVLDKDFPEIMPMRKGENRFVISRKKDRSLTSPQYKRRLAMEQADNSNFVPFVPFPPGYFAKKDNQSETGDPTKKTEADPVTSPVNENIQGNPEISIQPSNNGPNSGSTNSFESGQLDHANRSVGSSSQSWKSANSTQSAGNSLDNKKESWNFSSSQSDFSDGSAGKSIPSWNGNGESWGSPGGNIGGRTGAGNPQQSWNSNRENWNSQGGNFDGVNGGAGNPNPAWHANRDNWNSQGSNFGGSAGVGNPNTSWNNGRENWSGKSAPTSWNNDNLRDGKSQGGVSAGTNACHSAAPPPFNNNNNSWSGGYSSESKTGSRIIESPPQQPNVSPNTGESWNGSFSGKSLEGSAVTEPDPLDMSEEAKAQRWFRRVAQITDISELSNIPDEDFPSIMPMRKGVNRFVVSKRKTPLERRLTSPQYRRNLPVVSSEPDKDNNSNL